MTLSGGLWTEFGGSRIELFFVVLFAFIGLMALLGSLARLRGRGGQLAEYYSFLVLLVLCAIAVVFAQNLLLVFVFWELSTVALWRLVSYLRRDEDMDAGVWALYVNFAAAALMLVGLGMIWIQHGSLHLSALVGRQLSWTIAVLIFIGLLAKSATLPLYIWLPRAYHVAPAPVCALLSGVTENLGVVVFFKLFVQTVHAPEGFMVFTAALGIMSSIVAAGVALGRPTIRELLAYSTVSQLGFIFLGLAIAGYYGIVGGLLYVLAHALAKAGLFFTAGVVEETTGTEELEKLGGFYRRAPVLAGAAALLVLSMIGLPPMLGFFAKVVLVIAAVRENLLLGVGAIVAALFTVLYMSRLYVRMFLGPERTVPVRGVGGFVVGLVVVLATASIATGLTWFLIARYLEPALAGVIGS